MLPQSYYSSETPYSVSGPNASVTKLPPAEPSADTVIAASGEDAPAATSQNTVARGDNKQVRVGLRPLILGTVKITTSPAASSNSRLSSSSSTSSARYTATIPQARWSSYTASLTSPPSFATSSVSDKVASLKARLAESEAMAKDLMREKVEAASAARRFFVKLQSLRDQQFQWSEEKEVLIAKLRALDEDKATPVVPPPSEGVWFASSRKQQQVGQLKSQLASLKSSVDLGIFETQGTQRSEGKAAIKVRLGSLAEATRIPGIRVTPPEPSEANSGPEVNLTSLVDGGNQYLSPSSYRLLHPRTQRRSRERANATYRHSQCLPPTVRQSATLNSPPSSSLRRHFLKWPRMPADPHPPSASLRRQHLKWPRIPVNPLPELGPCSTRWPSGAPQVDASQRRLVDLGSQVIGTDPFSGSVERQLLHDRGNELLPLENAFADTRPSINLATAADLEARMKTVSSETKRPRGTVRNEPEINISPESLFESPSDIGGERRGFFTSLGRLGTPWRRSTSDRRFATVGQHAALESQRKRGPLGMFTSSFSPRGTTTEVAGDPQPMQKSRLRKLLNKGRSLISRV